MARSASSGALPLPSLPAVICPAACAASNSAAVMPVCGRTRWNVETPRDRSWPIALASTSTAVRRTPPLSSYRRTDSFPMTTTGSPVVVMGKLSVRLYDDKGDIVGQLAQADHRDVG